MKLLYYYDPSTKQMIDDQITTVDDDFKITDEKNATLVAPEQGLYTPLTFDADKQQWTGVTRDEWLDNLPPEEPAEPTNQEQIIAKLTAQLAQATAQTQHAISELTKQVATLKGGNE